ncbi:ATP-binding protein [Sedimenticola selenatireducens]|uniref:ATP-binding protein n=1 Tax=Sedimenticola selenatireducens TaxID=191960 RepID=A0A557SBT0_9GAMM|nr:ATP-binding protein [Sedimenticola selenatireducens]TVO74877.1 ATP-binding protein [Sedimenticola selenatireducens]TVT62413.1 MAG: ATP-binding protein [Sedimenticola selenatireducens]
MTANAETLIGRVTEVRENIMIAELTLMDGDDFPMVSSGGNEVAVGQLGTYIMVKQRGVEVVTMVIGAGQEYAVNAGGVRGMMTLVPLGELDENRSFHRGVIHYPTPGAEVHVVRPDEIAILFKKFQSTGFELGFLPSLTSLGVCLNPTALFGRHMAILGQSGAGKSWAVASILQRTVKVMPKAHVILLDLHGEYVWREGEQEHSAFTEGTYRYIDARNLEIPYWLLTYGELVDLLIDREDSKSSTQMAFLRELLLVLRRKANTGMEDAHISIDSPVYFSLSELFQQFKRANEQVTDFGKVKGALYGQFDEFLIKLQSRFNDVRYDFLFKPKRRKSSDTLADLLREFVGLVEPKRQITVIDFSSVPFDVRPTVSAQIGRLAFEFNYWNPQSREFPILLVCEEAHNYIPREAGTQFEGTRRSMERIAKEGRKYGVGLAVVSQRPHELSETVLAQCSSFICLRVTNPDDQQYIRDLVPDAESNLVNILAALGRGEAMALGEAVPLPTRFQFHRPSPEPNSNDIDFFNMWRDGPDTIDVEAIVRRWRRQGR